jgi:hypothetical protein
MKPVTSPLQLMVLLVLIGAITACKEFIEPSIKDSTVMLNAPGDQYQSTSYTVNFWWEQVEDARSYRLQIVTQSFQIPGSLIADTLVKGNKFSFNLGPGDYQWRLRAENGGMPTAYSQPRRFTVLPSSIKQQKVQLSAPGAGLLTNQGNLSFTWGSLYGATRYRWQIDTNSFSKDTAGITERLTPSMQVTFNLQKDQIYQWRVRAENDTAKAQWSTINTLTYDHTPPAQVNLTAPQNGQSAALPVALQWSGTGSGMRYKLYVFKGDSTSLYNNTFPITMTTSSYSFGLGSLGEQIYWRVTALDQAGNESIPSKLRNFVIQ